MKLILVFLMVISLTLGATACSGSPDTQKEIESSVEINSALSNVALEVPTMF